VVATVVGGGVFFLVPFDAWILATLQASWCIGFIRWYGMVGWLSLSYEDHCGLSCTTSLLFLFYLQELVVASPLSLINLLVIIIICYCL